MAVALALALVSALGACSDGSGEGSASGAVSGAVVTFEFSGVAATVAGDAVPASALRDTIEVFRASPAALQTAFGEASLSQEGSDQPKAAIVASVLSTEIASRVISAELATRGLSVTANARSLAETQVAASFKSSLDDHATFRQQLADRYAAYVTLDQALTSVPTEADLRARYEADPGAYDQACARHLLVATEAQAVDLVTQLRGGASFAVLAAANSSDTGSASQGGNLGCQARGMYVDAFEKAVWEGPVGQLQGPIKTEFGFHLIVVDSRGGRTFEAARDDVAEDLAPEPFAALGRWLVAKLAETTVSVDARFGTWDRSTGQVTPRGVVVGSSLPLTPAGAGG